MDFAMPHMNGIDAVRAIKKFGHGATVPILCVSAYGKQILEETAAAAFDVVIAKPIDFDACRQISAGISQTGFFRRSRSIATPESLPLNGRRRQFQRDKNERQNCRPVNPL